MSTDRAYFDRLTGMTMDELQDERRSLNSQINRTIVRDDPAHREVLEARKVCLAAIACRTGVYGRGC